MGHDGTEVMSEGIASATKVFCDSSIPYLGFGTTNLFFLYGNAIAQILQGFLLMGRKPQLCSSVAQLVRSAG